MRKLTILITAGPTHEYLDDVRYLANPSSGRMGIEVARAAQARGHRVRLVAGPLAVPPPAGIPRVDVVSALDMRRAVLRAFPAADAVVMTAAVGDWRPVRRTAGKMKRGRSSSTSSGRGGLVLRLVENPDILAELGRRRRPGQVLVGFALESRDPLHHARRKLARKRVDLIVLNSPESFGRDRARFRLVSATAATDLGPIRKKALAERLVRWIEDASRSGWPGGTRQTAGGRSREAGAGGRRRGVS